MKGKDIARIREKHGWTQVQFSQIIGRSVAQISRYETDLFPIPVTLRPLLRELDKNDGYVSNLECIVSTTAVRNEIQKILESTSSKAKLLQTLVFVKRITQNCAQ